MSKFPKIVTSEVLSEQTVKTHIDLCYDLFRRIFQFGSIHEIDKNKLIQTTFFNPKYKPLGAPNSGKSWTGFLKSGFGLTTQKQQQTTTTELNLTISEEMSFTLRYGFSTTKNSDFFFKLVFFCPDFYE